jgi:phthalate 4,5-cis-dihydrodiol dehydrogenase
MAATENRDAGAAPTRVLGVGMAGLGIGASQVIPGLAKMPEVRLAGAADLREGALKAFRDQFGAKTYTSVKELCEDPDVDVIWVATPNNMHCEHIVMAAEHGKHVVCEKPMALSMEQAEKMVETAAKNNVKMVCGHTYSLHPTIQAIKRVVRSGELGRLYAVNCWLYTDWLLKPRMPEEIDVNLGGGVVYRHGPHLIDTIRMLGGGMVRTVRAATGQWLPERPAPGNYSAFMEFENGTAATIAYSGYGYFYTSELTWGFGSRLYSDEQAVATRKALRTNSFDVEAEKEAMRFGSATGQPPRANSSADGSALPTDRSWFGVTLASCERGDIRQSPEGIYVYGDEGRREIPVERGRATGNQELRELYDAVVFDKPIVHDGPWGMATLEVCLAIMQSGREHREITLTHQCPARD